MSESCSKSMSNFPLNSKPKASRPHVGVSAATSLSSALTILFACNVVSLLSWCTSETLCLFFPVTFVHPIPFTWDIHSLNSVLCSNIRWVSLGILIYNSTINHFALTFFTFNFIDYTFYHFPEYTFISLRERKETLFCSLLQYMEECLAHSSSFINIYWKCECVLRYWYFPKYPIKY